MDVGVRKKDDVGDFMRLSIYLFIYLSIYLCFYLLVFLIY